MSDSQKNNMSQQDDEPICSDSSSMQEQNIRGENENGEHLIIQKEPNDARCATYIFNNEDHTLGNLIRTILSGHSDVQFVGYSIPHPSESKMNLRLQTISQDTNQVLNQAFKTVQNVTKTLREKFQESLKTYQANK